MRVHLLGMDWALRPGSAHSCDADALPSAFTPAADDRALSFLDMFFDCLLKHIDGVVNARVALRAASIASRHARVLGRRYDGSLMAVHPGREKATPISTVESRRGRHLPSSLLRMAPNMTVTMPTVPASFGRCRGSREGITRRTVPASIFCHRGRTYASSHSALHRQAPCVDVVFAPTAWDEQRLGREEHLVQENNARQSPQRESLAREEVVLLDGWSALGRERLFEREHPR